MTRSLPEDPLIRSLVVQARRAQVSRRTMLQGTGIGAAALTLAACSTGGSTKPTAAPDNSANDPTLTWANWSLYLDEDDAGNHPTLDRFTEETGIAVDYRVDVDVKQRRGETDRQLRKRFAAEALRQLADAVEGR